MKIGIFNTFNPPPWQIRLERLLTEGLILNCIQFIKGSVCSCSIDNASIIKQGTYITLIKPEWTSFV